MSPFPRSFGGRSARVGFLGRGVDAFSPLVKVASTAFWDAYLKDLPEARAFLTADGGLIRFAGTKAQWRVK
jgi:hypothetical protein